MRFAIAILAALAVGQGAFGQQTFDPATGKGTVQATVPAGATFILISSTSHSGKVSATVHDGKPLAAPYVMDAGAYGQVTHTLSATNNGNSVTFSGITGTKVDFVVPKVGDTWGSPNAGFYGTWTEIKLMNFPKHGVYAKLGEKTWLIHSQ